MSDRPVFLYAAIYDEIADAEADYEAVFDLHALGAIGTFDSAVIRKEEDGKVRVDEDREADPARSLDRRWGRCAGRDPVPACDHRRARSSAPAPAD